MKKVKAYFWLKSAGILSALIVMLIGAPGCRNKRHQTKYGPPPTDYDYDQTMTKYGVPIDSDTAFYDEPITKYGVPVDFDEYIEVPDTTKAE